jgi:type I restriction enzyme M protein
MSEEQKKQLEKQLWNIADTLRGKMHADEFRDYILGFIFYKYLSEKMLIKANVLLKTEGISYTEIDEFSNEWKEILKAIREDSIQDIGYFLKPSELFSVIAKRGNAKSDNIRSDSAEHGGSNFILWDLAKVLSNIQNSTMGADSEDDFEDLFSDLDLTSQKLGKTEAQKNELISKVLGHLDKIDFQLSNTEADVLWDAYEYLIAQFASGAGKKAGEFYTPQEVSKILAKIVTTGKKQIKSAYDPTCGSGSLLLRISKEAEVWEFFGQELNRTTYNLARMNMILHGVHYSRFNIKQEDTLEYPQHIDKRFEAIVANPPFSAHWKADSLKMSDDRFSQYGKLAPGTKADFAFVQHMIHHLDENGTMAVVLPHGALFRGATERHIRKYLIEDRNYLDAVIGLPTNIFYGTPIPTCILVFKKCRENPKNVIFIDASNHFQKIGNQNVLKPSNIEKIIETFRKREIEEKYSHVATLQEIANNDYNLNISRYIDTFEEEEIIDINEVSEKIKSIDVNMKEIDMEIVKYCKELGIESPF